MSVRFGCVVEGHGEREAVPVLIRRIAETVDPGLVVKIERPVRIPKSRLVKEGELERAVRLAALSISGNGAILVILDSDDDCPAEVGPVLAGRVRSARPDLPSAVVLPKREFEAWFLAAAESLRGRRGLPEDLEPPAQPESVRGAKEWLSSRMVAHGYSETVDQPALTAALDVNAARRADSFDKCYREVVRLLRELSRRDA
ncbi:MAG: DUF4276 family protein [Bryobacteraceae bacterium]